MTVAEHPALAPRAAINASANEPTVKEELNLLPLRSFMRIEIVAIALHSLLNIRASVEVNNRLINRPHL